MGHQYEPEVRALFENVPVRELHELCVSVLRQWRRKGDVPPLTFRVRDDLARPLVPLIAARKGIAHTDLNLLGPELDRFEKPWFSSLVEFVWWLSAAGLGVVAGWNGVNPVMVRLTEAGARFLDGDEDHPLWPGFLERLRARCPKIPDGVLDLVEDGSACLQRGLMRPAVAVLGVAIEAAVEAIIESLIATGHLQPQLREKSASVRIGALRPLIPVLIAGTTKQDNDDRRAIDRALLFADDLRRRRNDAAHTRPRFGFDDRGEVEELLLSTGRQLPVLWLLYR